MNLSGSFLATSLICLLSTGTAVAAGLSGAIFTTVVDGTRVDANIYEAKEYVYLDGGPRGGSPATAAGLPEGDYFYQVTDPSGAGSALHRPHLLPPWSPSWTARPCTGPPTR